MRPIKLLIALLLPISAMCQQVGDRITLDDFFKGTFSENGIVQPTPMNDGQHYAVIEEGTKIVKYSYKTGKRVATLATVEQLGDSTINYFISFEFDRSESKIIFFTNYQSIYRRSFTADYYVWDIAAKKLTAVSNERRQQVATLSPDGTMVAYVSGNNLYIKRLADETETQVTTDGLKNSIINGIPDWVGRPTAATYRGAASTSRLCQPTHSKCLPDLNPSLQRTNFIRRTTPTSILRPASAIRW